MQIIYISEKKEEDRLHDFVSTSTEEIETKAKKQQGENTEANSNSNTQLEKASSQSFLPRFSKSNLPSKLSKRHFLTNSSSTTAFIKDSKAENHSMMNTLKSESSINHEDDSVYTRVNILIKRRSLNFQTIL